MATTEHTTRHNPNAIAGNQNHLVFSGSLEQDPEAFLKHNSVGSSEGDATETAINMLLDRHRNDPVSQTELTLSFSSNQGCITEVHYTLHSGHKHTAWY